MKYNTERREMLEGYVWKYEEEWTRMQEMKHKRMMEALLGLSGKNKWDNTIGMVKQYLERVYGGTNMNITQRQQ